MRFGYTIIYTDDVEKSIEFFERAFGLKRRFVHESGYGELDTGSTALAFATHDLGRGNLPDGYIKANERVPGSGSARTGADARGCGARLPLRTGVRSAAVARRSFGLQE